MMSQMMSSIIQKFVMMSFAFSDIFQIIFIISEISKLSFMTLILSVLQIFVVIFNLLLRNQAIEHSYRMLIIHGISGNFLVLLSGYVLSNYIIKEKYFYDKTIFYTYYSIIINLNIYSSIIYVLSWISIMYKK